MGRGCVEDVSSNNLTYIIGDQEGTLLEEILGKIFLEFFFLTCMVAEEILLML